VKRPDSPSLLASDEAWDKYRADLYQYFSELLRNIEEESNLKDPTQIIFYLCEKYHPKYKLKEKKGAKTKWDSLLKATLFVDLEARKKRHPLVKSAIYELINDPIWSKMFKNSDSPFDLVKTLSAEGKRDKFSCKLAKDVYEDCLNGGIKFAENWETFIKDGINDCLKSK
jgi:hypothetical protein